MEGISGTPKTLEDAIKGREAINKIHSAITDQSLKNFWKTSLRFKKRDKGENTVRDPEIDTKWYT